MKRIHCEFLTHHGHRVNYDTVWFNISSYKCFQAVGFKIRLDHREYRLAVIVRDDEQHHNFNPGTDGIVALSEFNQYALHFPRLEIVLPTVFNPIQNVQSMEQIVAQSNVV